MVFLLEVLEYVFDPVRALKNINSLMKKGGVLYLSSHTWYPVHNPAECDYLRYTRAGICKLLGKTGFIIKDIIPREEVVSPYVPAGMLMRWFDSQKMKASKDYQYHNEVGHLIKAIKK